MKPEAVERLMRAAGYMDDVEDFADALGVEDTTVRRWLSGEVKSISRTSRKLLRDLKAHPGFEISLNDYCFVPMGERGERLPSTVDP